ncbi:TolC family protein [uncultured Draconibacterium sp.]|uniref:TolC family protein n=1 Tax=uncultured Draconibacterium sp. TaxID=1573823 RepID=UPI002AA7A7E1|nr:TolC family protein [uncultured Draconibacterium sp.]
MNIRLKIKLISLLLIGVVAVLKAQTYDELLAKTAEGTDISEKLPPLHELQRLAIENSPIFKLLDADVEIGAYKVKEEKREWMQSLGVEGGARYGLFDNLIISQDLGLVESNTQTTEQTRYYFGGFLKIPLSAIFDDSNVRTAKAENEKLKYQREARIQELRQLIIVRYYNVIREFRGIIIKTNAVENYRVQRIRAEEDFLNGKITIDEYARLEDMLTKAVLSLEETKLDFTSAFQILEETVGVPIKLKE